MNRNKLIYWIATAPLCLMMLGSAGMYVFDHAGIVKVFETLGYPEYIVYPLAAAKILGVIAILTGYSRTLKEWAYAGFFFDFILAFLAHLYAGDGGFFLPVVAIILLLVSYFSNRTNSNLVE